MSRFHGSQPKGARAFARETRMYQAYLRQVAHQQHEGYGALDPEDMLTARALAKVERGNVDVESWAPVVQAEAASAVADHA